MNKERFGNLYERKSRGRMGRGRGRMVEMSGGMMKEWLRRYFGIGVVGVV